MEKRNRIYGYARVSTREQNLDRQIHQLGQYVSHENILVDKASGKNLERQGYQALKGALGLREGDVLYITSLDRLSRNKQDIKKELEWYKEKHIRLKILDLPTSLIEVPEGNEWIQEMITNILVEVLSSIAEQERITIHRRQAEGIAAAKEKGKYLGRPKIEKPPAWKEVILKLERKEITAVKAMEILGMKRSSFYKLLRNERKEESAGDG